jgi:hypothetical protein
MEILVKKGCKLAAAVVAANPLTPVLTKACVLSCGVIS